MQVLEAIYTKALRDDLFNLLGQGLELFQHIFAIYPLSNMNHINMPLCFAYKNSENVVGFQFLEIIN